MKKSLFQILSFAVILAFIMPAMTDAQTGKVNFSGTWAFNESKSDMGQQPQGGGGGQRGGFGGGSFTVKQEANLLTVERTRTGQDGQTVTTTEKYTLDGKESINTSQRGESKSVATWAADGKSLTIVTTRTFDRNGESMTMTTKAVWTIDGANLNVASSTETPNGPRTTKMVYDKK